MPKSRSEQFWSEPFRPFFILGWVISLVSLAVWPLFFLGAIDYPARAHAFLMIQGFFASFAVGFLWTALPRMLEVPGPGRNWIAGGLALIGGNALFHLAGFHLIAHMLFLGLLFLIGRFGYTRFSARQDLPPPSFVLVISGLLLGSIGTLLVALGDTGISLGYFYSLGRLLLMEIFLLYLVLGVAAFLAPRFFKQPSKQNFPESRTPSEGWKRQAMLGGAVGGVILIGAMIQAAGSIRLGATLVAVAATGYVLYQVPLWRGLTQGKNWMATGLAISLLCALAAPWARLLFPEARIATVHLLLLGGFGLLTLIVGTRVVFGHSGYSHLFKTSVKPIGLITGLYMASLIIRLSGEIHSALWTPFLLISALLLIGAHAVWGWLALPKIFAPREET